MEASRTGPSPVLTLPQEEELWPQQVPRALCPGADHRLNAVPLTSCPPWKGPPSPHRHGGARVSFACVWPSTGGSAMPPALRVPIVTLKNALCCWPPAGALLAAAL